MGEITERAEEGPPPTPKEGTLGPQQTACGFSNPVSSSRGCAACSHSALLAPRPSVPAAVSSLLTATLAD